jgi:acylglycerol lipase
MHHQFVRASKDGLDLFFQEWRPEGELRAVVGLVHGLGEHSGRYLHLADYLNNKGYALVAIDLRGHGHSGGRRGHTPSYEALMDDIDVLFMVIAERFPETSIFIYGHSMGGNLVLNYMLRRKPTVKGAVVTGPWLKLAFEPPVSKKILAKGVGAVWPGFTQKNQLDPAQLSHEPHIGATSDKDQLAHNLISARLFIVIHQAGEWALLHATEFLSPLLLMHGSEDMVTSAKASQIFAGKAGDCELIIWDGLYHELHNEPEYKEVFETAVTWMNRIIGIK